MRFPLQKSSMPFILAFASVLRRRSFLWGFLFFWQPYREASLPAIRKSREDPPYRPFPLCHDLSFCGAHSLLCHFQETYNIMLFNGMKDDMHAIWDTAVKNISFSRALWVSSFYRPLSSIFGIGCRNERALRLSAASRPFCWCAAFHPYFAIFCRFGGGFHSDDGIHWESAARTKSKLLNEAILDDGQALYRAYATHKRATEKFCAPLRWRKCGRPFGFLAAMGTRRPSMKPLRAPKRRQPASSGPPCRGHLRGKLCPLAPFAFL